VIRTSARCGLRLAPSGREVRRAQRREPNCLRWLGPTCARSGRVRNSSIFCQTPGKRHVAQEQRPRPLRNCYYRPSSLARFPTAHLASLRRILRGAIADASLRWPAKLLSCKLIALPSQRTPWLLRGVRRFNTSSGLSPPKAPAEASSQSGDVDSRPRTYRFVYHRLLPLAEAALDGDQHAPTTRRLATTS
jgi:hypothetical protein